MSVDVATPQSLEKVVVVYGGTSAEREVSLKSGSAVLAALQRKGVNACGYDPRDNGLVGLERLAPSLVFVALHGRGGEDGTLQGALELLDIPYTGSGVLASALGMDKQRTKQVWSAVGLPTPESIMLEATAEWSAVVEQLGLPLIVKPVHEGSTLGISIVKSQAALEAAYHEAAQFDARVMAERFVVGEEYTVALLGDQVLPAIRVEVPGGFYDYEAKYIANTTQYHLPCGLSAQHEAELALLCQQAFAAIGGVGWGRVDVMRDSEGRFWLLEVNTVPGMTDHSLVPQAAAHAGISFDDLVLRILNTAGEQFTA
ncbi:D-alanine--D-alanine ligase [Vreelandella titanicae]|uniref:D-alanine--D-alanine ligase n=1 Tax=Vreelandella titanicae BH1 TaxID=1204738 RepID=L9UB51_9GAMM|nr:MULTISPECIES: D-alanine--D-alanine ligase [Halomonas]NAO97350.1 D-alanine--D-alanine ligase [Halomonas sp. MG34]QGQ70200.1 D-alanine--D-alanine ligase [Halomonas sp. PA16-9]ELY22084.1 D-alanine--D-alanine ligase [Halomonas titanicae BH1]KIN16609.1 D-alanine--D-alanine ligase [Halomonas sp. KHS3]MCD1585321.1 D-alanine--D-alanine ligase [Halomonas sp. IOP_14]